MKFTAQPGRGDGLAALLLRAAKSLQDVAGCELYVVNRSSTEPDVVWVTELWLSQEALEASLEELDTEEGRSLLAEVTGLLAGPPERIDLEPLGGVGYLPGGTGYTHLNLAAFEAGPEGLEFLVFGARHKGDAEVDRAFWPAEAT